MHPPSQNKCGLVQDELVTAALDLTLVPTMMFPEEAIKCHMDPGFT
jgi:hypothetical protein